MDREDERWKNLEDVALELLQSERVREALGEVIEDVVRKVVSEEVSDIVDALPTPTLMNERE